MAMSTWQQEENSQIQLGIIDALTQVSYTQKLREDTQRDPGPSCFVGGHWHRPTGGILTPGFIALLKMLAPPSISARSSFAGSRQG